MSAKLWLSTLKLLQKILKIGSCVTCVSYPLITNYKYVRNDNVVICVLALFGLFDCDFVHCLLFVYSEIDFGTSLCTLEHKMCQNYFFVYTL